MIFVLRLDKLFRIANNIPKMPTELLDDHAYSDRHQLANVLYSCQFHKYSTSLQPKEQCLFLGNLHNLPTDHAITIWKSLNLLVHQKT